MVKKIIVLFLTLLLCPVFLRGIAEEIKEGTEMERIKKTEEEWKSELPPEVFHVTREKGTERAFTGKYNSFKGQGMYQCVACGLELFDSKTKFESGSGWPSFWAPIKEQNIGYEVDTSHFMTRTEVHCPRCGAHLGHVFEDGPAPTGKRYCINSVSLKFSPEKKNS